MEMGIVFLDEVSSIHHSITGITNKLAIKPAYGLRYISFEDDFPDEICHAFREHGMTPILTWEFFFPSRDGHNRRQCPREETHVEELLAGKYDPYIQTFAMHVKRWNDLVYLRPFHEFNAKWYVWGGEKNGGADGGPELVKQGWTYLVKKFRELNVDNVRWIWCAHEPSVLVSLERWNHIRQYWPGDEYVDVLGIDGFNFYPENPERADPDFYSFEALFSDMYTQMTALSNKPLFIMTGTSEFYRNGAISCKADWIRDAFEKIANVYTQIAIMTWLHYQFNEQIDWRIDSSDASLKAFNDAMPCKTL
jgi:hypothetical protein